MSAKKLETMFYIKNLQPDAFRFWDMAITEAML